MRGISRLGALPTPGEERALRGRLRFYAANTELVAQRLRDLEDETALEEAVELTIAGLVSAGVALGALVDRRGLGIAALGVGWLVLHATGGLTPTVPMLRRLRFRSRKSIDEERVALRWLRGDFHGEAPLGMAPRRAAGVALRVARGGALEVPGSADRPAAVPQGAW